MIRYLPAGASDKSLLFFLYKENIDLYEDRRHLRYASTLMQIRDKIEDHIRDYTVIWQDDRKVGYFYKYPTSNAFEWELYLFPEYRGQGIGTQVLTDQLAGQTEPVTLHVFLRNTRAIAFYRRLGFRVTQTLRDSLHLMERSFLLPDGKETSTATHFCGEQAVLSLCCLSEHPA